MPWPWMLRWFAMLLIFAFSTVAFSAYAGATPPITDVGPQPVADADLDVDTDYDSDAAGAENRDSGDVQHQRYDTTADYMLTITRSALLGAVLGGLVGGSVYIISQRQVSPWTIAYFAAGGVFFGATVGTIQIIVRSSQNDRDRVDARLHTFDDALKNESHSRMPAEPVVPLFQWTF